LVKDLTACGIPYEDDHGRVDFHALRHTFSSLLATVGVSELVRVKLSRHRSWKQTDRYTDPHSIPLFAEMDKFALALPSPIPSPKSGELSPKAGNVVQSDFTTENEKVLPLRGEKPLLGKAVPSWESSEMVPEGTRTPK